MHDKSKPVIAGLLAITCGYFGFYRHPVVSDIIGEGIYYSGVRGFPFY